jgi:hypothetical protein
MPTMIDADVLLKKLEQEKNEWMRLGALTDRTKMVAASEWKFARANALSFAIRAIRDLMENLPITKDVGVKRMKEIDDNVRELKEERSAIEDYLRSLNTLKRLGW